MKAIHTFTFISTLLLSACGSTEMGANLAGISRDDGASHDANDDRGQGRDHDRGDRSDRGERGRGRDARIATPATQSVTIGNAFSLTLERTRAGDDDVYVFSAAGLPEGLTIDATTGGISGVVQGAAGTFDVVVSFREAGERATHRARTISFQIIVTAK